MKVNIELDIIDFDVPDYIYTKSGRESIEIEKLSEKNLIELCDRFKKAVLGRCKK